MTANLHIGDRFSDAHAQSYMVQGVLFEGPSESLYVVQSSPGAPLQLLRLLASNFATETPEERASNLAITSPESTWLQAAAKLELPTLSTAHVTGLTSSGQRYWLFATPSGESLLAHLKRQGPMSPDVAIAAACQLGDALLALQAIGISQTELYPDAIIVDSRPVDSSGVRSWAALRAVMICHGLRRVVPPVDGPAQSRTSRATGIPVETVALAGLLLGMMSGIFDESTVTQAGSEAADPTARLDTVPLSVGLRQLLRRALSGKGQPSAMALSAFLRELRSEVSARTEPMTEQSREPLSRARTMASLGSPNERGPLALPRWGSYVMVASWVVLVGGLTHMLLSAGSSPVPFPTSVADALPVDASIVGAVPGTVLRADLSAPTMPAQPTPQGPVMVQQQSSGSTQSPVFAQASKDAPIPNPSSSPSAERSAADSAPSLTGSTKDAPATKPAQRSRFSVEAQFATTPVPSAARKAAHETALSCLGSVSQRTGLPIDCAVELSVRPKPDGGWIATIVRPPCSLSISSITSLEVCISKQLDRRAINPAIKSFLFQRHW